MSLVLTSADCNTQSKQTLADKSKSKHTGFIHNAVFSVALIHMGIVSIYIADNSFIVMSLFPTLCNPLQY